MGTKNVSNDARSVENPRERQEKSDLVYTMANERTNQNSELEGARIENVA